jgi:hypothetical protein
MEMSASATYTLQVRRIQQPSYIFFSTLNILVCSRLGKVYTRRAYDNNNKEVEYNVDLVEEVYHNSCICQSTNIIPTFSKNNRNNDMKIFPPKNNSDNDMSISLPNNNSNNDMNISPLVLSFYAERKEHLVVEIEQREKALSRKRKETEDEELIILKRRNELDLVNEIMTCSPFNSSILRNHSCCLFVPFLFYFSKTK